MYWNIGVSFSGIFNILATCLLSDSLYPFTSQLLFISLKWDFLLLLTKTNSEITNPDFFFMNFLVCLWFLFHFFFSFYCILSSVVFFNFSGRNFVIAADCSGILQEFRPLTSSYLWFFFADNLQPTSGRWGFLGLHCSWLSAGRTS